MSWLARARRGISLPQLTTGLLFGAIALMACLMPAEGDSYWHLRAGQDIWRTLHVSLVDRYSYTVTGGYWPNQEWLWQAFAYALHRMGGMPLLELGSAAIVTAACAVFYRLCAGSAGTRLVLFALALPLATRAWALRPQLMSSLGLALLLWLLVRERHRWLPLLFLVWANAHGAVVLGIAILVAVALVAGVEARRGAPPARHRAIELAVLTPICALTTLLTPLGVGLWRYIGTSTALSRANRIREWQPTWPTGPFGILFWALALAFVGLVVWRRRRLRGAPWGDIVLLTASFATLVLAARAIRITCVFLLVAPPAASRLLGPDFRWGRRPRPPSPDHPRVNLALLVAISALEAAGVVRAWTTSNPMLGWQPISAGALAAARACPGRIFNRYNDGGYLIWFLPEKQVFSDTRQDPYPLAITRQTVSIEHGGPYRDTFARYGIRCAILPLDAGAAIARLAGDGWQARFQDDGWTVLEAPGL